ncbi:MAG TPA: RNase adapter RapZ [Oscillatoriaceae cyanobacterium]
MDPSQQILIITGLSGAGKTRALRCFEDLGYFCVDNLIPQLLPRFIELTLPRFNQVAVVMDIRGGVFFDGVEVTLEKVFNAGYPVKVIFLEAADEALVKRFSETRRRHPMLGQDASLLGSIRRERERLVQIRASAQAIIDTTELSPRQLKDKLLSLFIQDEQMSSSMQVTVQSFGYKFGPPLDSDLIFDVRFLPNPHYDTALRPFTGLDEPVQNFVLTHPVTQEFLTRFNELVTFLLPHYLSEGKTHLSIGIGCTGGRHRSVAIARYLVNELREAQYRVVENHRDINRQAEYYTAKDGPEAASPRA